MCTYLYTIFDSCAHNPRAYCYTKWTTSIAHDSSLSTQLLTP